MAKELTGVNSRMVSSAGASPPRSQVIRELFRSASDGSSEAVDRLLEMFRPYLLVIAQTHFDPKLHGKAGPSDLVQETLFEAHRDLPDFEWSSLPRFRAWLKRLLLHNLTDFNRRYQQSAMRDIRREKYKSACKNHLLNVIDSKQTASGATIVKEEWDRILAGLTRLSEAQRTVILLRCQDQLSFAEIATRLGKNEDAARLFFHRSIAKLKSELGET